MMKLRIKDLPNGVNVEIDQWRISQVEIDMLPWGIPLCVSGRTRNNPGKRPWITGELGGRSRDCCLGNQGRRVGFFKFFFYFCF